MRPVAGPIAAPSRIMNSSLHAIFRLPEELLSMIFVEWLDANHYDFHGLRSGYRILKWSHRAFRLAAVSQKWRRIAISTPQLWRFIDIELERVTAASQGAWTEYLHTCLSRSGALHLELEVEGTLKDSECQSLPEFWTLLRTCCARARTIDMDLAISEPPMPTLFIRCLAQDMPYLEYCALNCSRYGSIEPPLQITLFPTAPRLWYLSYYDLGLVWPTNSIFPNVTSANITTERMTTAVLVDIFQHLPNIEDLEVCTQFLFATDTSIDLSVLRCTTLHKFAFHAEGFDEMIVQNMDFPNLRSAVFTFNSHPTLGVTPAAFATFFGHTLRAVCVLALSDFKAIGEGLLDYLHSMPELSSLWLERSGTPGLADLLAKLSRPDTTGVWPCPRLQQLTLSAWDVHSAEWRGIALHIATARGPCASPRRRPPRLLESVRVTYSHVTPFEWSSRIGSHDDPDAESLQTALDLLLRGWDEDSEDS